jgi:primosomal protein N'
VLDSDALDADVFAKESLSANPFPLNGRASRRGRKRRAAIGRFQPLLLEGVTGSGKTEVYLQRFANAWRAAGRRWCWCRKSA